MILREFKGMQGMALRMVWIFRRAVLRSISKAGGRQTHCPRSPSCQVGLFPLYCLP